MSVALGWAPFWWAAYWLVARFVLNHSDPKNSLGRAFVEARRVRNYFHAELVIRRLATHLYAYDAAGTQTQLNAVLSVLRDEIERLWVDVCGGGLTDEGKVPRLGEALPDVDDPAADPPLTSSEVRAMRPEGRYVY